MQPDSRFPIAHRWQERPLRLRDASVEGRTLYGTVVTYDTPVTVDDGDGPYREAFAPGAFSRSIEQAGSKVRLYTQHDRQRLPIGKAVEYDDHARGLDVAFLVSDVPDGNAALTLVRDEVVDSFSVGFRGISARNDNGVTVRTEAALIETSIVAHPAYPGAKIAGIRTGDVDPEHVEWWLSLDTATRAAIMAADPAAFGTVTDSPADRHDAGITHAEARLRLLTLRSAA